MTVNFKNIRIQFVLATIILLLPYSLLLHLLASNSQMFLNFFNIQIFHGYPDNRVFLWFVLNALIPITLLSIWFVNCGYKWKYFILFPLLAWIDSLLRYYLYEFTWFGISPYFVSIGFSTLYILFLIRLERKSRLNEAKPIEWMPTSPFTTFLNKKYINYFNWVLSTKSDNLSRLFYKKLNIQNLLKNKYTLENEKMSKKSYPIFLDILIGFVLLLSSLLRYLDDFIPENLQEFSFLGFTLDNYGFLGVDIFVSVFAMKMMNLVPLLIWFFTSKVWWKYALFSPIIATVYQLLELFYDTNVDELSFLYAAPWVLGLCIFLMLLAGKFKYVAMVIEYQETIEKEIERLLGSAENEDATFTAIKKKFELLKLNAGNRTGNKPADLLKLKDELSKRLRDFQ